MLNRLNEVYNHLTEATRVLVFLVTAKRGLTRTRLLFIQTEISQAKKIVDALVKDTLT